MADRGSGSRGGSYNPRGGSGRGHGGPDNRQRYDQYPEAGPSSGRGHGGGFNLPYRPNYQADGRWTESSRGGNRGGGNRGGRGGNRGVAPRIYLEGTRPPPPDKQVQKLENSLLKSTSNRIIDRFPGRSSYGSQGRPIVLRTNHFTVNAHPRAVAPQDLHKYGMEWKPTLSGPKRRRAVTQILKESFLTDVDHATDYGEILVTTQRLNLGSTDEKVITLTLEAPGTAQPMSTGFNVSAFAAAARRRNTFECTIRRQGVYNLTEYFNSLRSESSGAEYPGAKSILQILGTTVIMLANSDTTIAKVGGNKFFPTDKALGAISQSLGGGLEAFRGYYCSPRPAIGRLLLNVNVTSGAFYEAKGFDKLVYDFQNNLPALEVFVQRLRIAVSYKKTSKQTLFMVREKSIQGFAERPRFGDANTVTFRWTDPSDSAAQEQTVTIKNYFLRHYGITLERPRDPVLNVGTRENPSYVPMELCSVLPGQPYRKRLSAGQTTEMLNFACRRPHENAASIVDMGLKVFGLRDPANPRIQESTIGRFGFGAEIEMVTVPGRILDSPAIYYDRKRTNIFMGSWNMSDVHFSRGGSFGKWKILVINNALPDVDQPRGLSAELEKTLRRYGVNMGQRLRTDFITLAPLVREQRGPNNTHIKNAFQVAKEQLAELVFVVLPGQDTWLYARIKYNADVVYGIHTIACVGSKIQKSKGLAQYLANIALKFNVKSGGISHVVENTLVGPVDKDTMFVGIDVTHPSPGSMRQAPSIACVVASTDAHLFQWPGSIRSQTSRVEMVEALTEMVTERLKLWQKKHQKLPNKIVVYRDGVSEGQFSLVLEHEYPCFTRAYTNLYGSQKQWPRTTIVIVGKRHHTRFNPTDWADTDEKTGNPLPGTVVDRGIANRIIQEFWLQAHASIKGQARPAHYSVIKDEIGFQADQLQKLTHNLCYHFVRCTRAVSICPPAYYADLLAERGRAYLYSIFQENDAGDGASTTSTASFELEWNGGVHPDLAESTWYI